MNFQRQMQLRLEHGIVNLEDDWHRLSGSLVVQPPATEIVDEVMEAETVLAFQRPFKDLDFVYVGMNSLITALRSVHFGCSDVRNVRLDVFVKDRTLEGFTVVVRNSTTTVPYAVSVSWLAVGK